MSIEATEYVVVPEGGTPEVVPPPCGIGEAVPVGFSRWTIELRVQCHNTAAGVRFLEWLREKIRADQEAAKAIGLAYDGSKAPQSTSVEHTRADGQLVRITIGPDNVPHVVPIITEGDAAPSAAVHDIKPTPRGAP